eukprot:CCRYP_002797-RA/>CCRYP_002797-RA protein AED:0.00 eAED:0.00 QI:30/1/1/1/0/0/2/26/54
MRSLPFSVAKSSMHCLLSKLLNLGQETLQETLDGGEHYFRKEAKKLMSMPWRLK